MHMVKQQAGVLPVSTSLKLNSKHLRHLFMVSLYSAILQRFIDEITSSDCYNQHPITPPLTCAWTHMNSRSHIESIFETTPAISIIALQLLHDRFWNYECKPSSAHAPLDSSSNAFIHMRSNPIEIDPHVIVHSVTALA